jgi:hypothetical protein
MRGAKKSEANQQRPEQHGNQDGHDRGEDADRGVPARMVSQPFFVLRRRRPTFWREIDSTDPCHGTRLGVEAARIGFEECRSARTAEATESDPHHAELRPHRRRQPDRVVHRPLLDDQLLVDVPAQPSRKAAARLHPVPAAVGRERPDLEDRTCIGHPSTLESGRRRAHRQEVDAGATFVDGSRIVGHSAATTTGHTAASGGSAGVAERHGARHSGASHGSPP